MRIPPELLQRCWFLAGPTACGKSEAGVELARRLGAEILAMDSMSLYRGMDIGTAKTSPELRGAVPHHLIDILDPHEESSVAQYIAQAGDILQNVLDRGRIPLFVGGTALYLRSLLRGVFEGPAADRRLREALATEAARSPPDTLYQRLQAIDPAAARALHPRDTRRIIRALEVHALTGRPLSEQQRQRALPPDDRPRHVFWLSPPRAWLHDRINARVEQMIAEGFIEEVRQLFGRTLPLGRTARQGVGYKEVIDHLEGRLTRAEMITSIQTRTRQFAKRQHTWFRHMEECRPIPLSGDEGSARVAERILSIADRS